jgi:hypothetical protein
MSSSLQFLAVHDQDAYYGLSCMYMYDYVRVKITDMIFPTTPNEGVP